MRPEGSKQKSTDQWESCHAPHAPGLTIRKQEIWSFTKGFRLLSPLLSHLALSLDLLGCDCMGVLFLPAPVCQGLGWIPESRAGGPKSTHRPLTS